MNVLVLVSVLLAGTVLSPQPSDLLDGAGMVEHSQLSMLFEATVFKLDVAEVETFLTARTAERLGPVLADQSSDGETTARIGEILMQADSVVFRLSFLRDLSWGRFLGRTRQNLLAAVESGEWTREQFDRIWPSVETAFSPMEERGVRDGDALYYVVSGDTVRSVFYGEDSEILLQFEQFGEERSRGIRAAFFAPGSDFREKLLRSLLRPGSP